MAREITLYIFFFVYVLKKSSNKNVSLFFFFFFYKRQIIYVLLVRVIYFSSLVCYLNPEYMHCKTHLQFSLCVVILITN